MLAYYAQIFAGTQFQVVETAFYWLNKQRIQNKIAESHLEIQKTFQKWVYPMLSDYNDEEFDKKVFDILSNGKKEFEAWLNFEIKVHKSI